MKNSLVIFISQNSALFVSYSPKMHIRYYKFLANVHFVRTTTTTNSNTHTASCCVTRNPFPLILGTARTLSIFCTAVHPTKPTNSERTWFCSASHERERFFSTSGWKRIFASSSYRWKTCFHSINCVKMYYTICSWKEFKICCLVLCIPFHIKITDIYF